MDDYMDNEYEELDYDDSPSEDKFEDVVTEVKTEFIEGELIYETHSNPIYKQIPKDFFHRPCDGYFIIEE